MKKNFINFHFQNQVKADEQKFQKGKKYVVFFLIFARQEIEKVQFFVKKKNAIFSHFQNQVKADEQQFQNLKKYLIFFQIFTRQGIENLIIFVKKIANLSNIFINNILRKERRPSLCFKIKNFSTNRFCPLQRVRDILEASNF